MKKTLVFTIIACFLIIAVVAGVLIFVLSGNGGSIEASFNNIFDNTHVNVSEDPEKMYSDFEHNNEIIWEDASQVDSIDFGWVSGHMNVRIVEDGDTIRIVEYSNRELKEDEKMKISQSGGTLEIRYDEKFFSFSLFDGTINLRKALLVEIPKNVADEFTDVKLETVSADITADPIKCENFKFGTTSGNAIIETLTVENDIDFSSVSGEITISGVTSKTLKMSTTSGDLRASEVITEDFEASSVSGNVRFSGTCKTVRSNTTSGEVTVSTDEMITEADMSSVSGDIELKLPENDGFTAEYSSVSGDFKCRFEVKSDSSDHNGTVTYKDGNAKIKMSTTSGEMDIDEK